MSYLIQYEPDFQGNDWAKPTQACRGIATSSLVAQVKALEKKIARAEAAQPGITKRPRPRSSRWLVQEDYSNHIPAVLRKKGYSLSWRGTHSTSQTTASLFSLHCPVSGGVWEALSEWPELYELAGINKADVKVGEMFTPNRYRLSRRPDGRTVITYGRYVWTGGADVS